MFTGIIEAIGSVRAVTRGESESARFTIESPFDDLTLGASVCVSGVCLTVVRMDGGTFEVDVSAETLRRSTLGDLCAGDPVNLERSLRLGDRLGGHLVFGHVDGVGRVESITIEGGSWLFRFTAPESVARYLVEKGSVAVDGISLTVFACQRGEFTVALIPHTASVTTLGTAKPGSAVNLEADMIGKYVESFARPHLERAIS